MGIDPFLIAKLGAPRLGSGHEVRFLCPCEECRGRDDYKLYVNLLKGVFFCLRSSWGGGLRRLYKYLGVEVEEPPAPSDLREAIGRLENPELVEAGIVLDNQEVAVPPTVNFEEHQGAWSWLLGRFQGVPLEETRTLVERQIVRPGTGRHWDRVFFVDMYNAKSRYWTARTIFDFQPKYLNPYRVPRHSILYNQYWIEEDHWDEVVICEGVISAIVAGPNAVATYGRCVTDEQLRILDTLPCSRFVIASEPDTDAKQNTMELASALVGLHRIVDIVDCPPDTDPAKLGREAFRYLVEHQSVRFTWGSGVVRRLKCL